MELEWYHIPAALAGIFLSVHIVPYVVDPFKERRFDGPFLAKFSDVWLGYWSVNGKRSERVHELHRKYGKWVRIAPNHISIAEPEALQIVYAHGNLALKSDFYDAFVSIRRGLFNTRSRAEHTRKRKIVSHIFSQKNVLDFEVHVRDNLSRFVKQWDAIAKGKGLDGEARGNRVWYDCLPWYNYLAFDIIGDLAFGSPFGMIQAGKDVAPVTLEGTTSVVNVPAIQILNDRGEFSASLGVLPSWARPYIKKSPWFAKGAQAVQNLAGLAIAAVNKRLSSPDQGRPTDLLSKLQTGKDDSGNPMGREELTAEALTQLIAGSDTTSNSSCAITYYLAKHPAVQKKLQAELDEALGDLPPVDLELEDEAVVRYEQVKSLPYLEAVINEALRLHSTSSMGLPRVVPAGGMEVLGQWFDEGAILSVPSYTIHRDPEVWGKDVEAFRPERWFEGDQTMIQKTFNPFSYGPRACVGKNLANMELLLIIGTVFRRYEFVLEDPTAPLETREGFLRKPLHCRVGMKRRE